MNRQLLCGCCSDEEASCACSQLPARPPSGNRCIPVWQVRKSGKRSTAGHWAALLSSCLHEGRVMRNASALELHGRELRLAPHHPIVRGEQQVLQDDTRHLQPPFCHPAPVPLVLEPSGCVGFLALALLPLLAALLALLLVLLYGCAQRDLMLPCSHASLCVAHAVVRPRDEGVQLPAKSNVIGHAIDAAGFLVELLS